MFSKFVPGSTIDSKFAQADKNYHQPHPDITPVIFVRMKGARRHSYNDHGRVDKKSMVVNVKTKVKKWKRLLPNKKQNNVRIPPWHSQLKEKEGSDPDEYEEQYPEFYGAPMYGSETAPDIYEDFKQKPAVDPDPIQTSTSDSSIDSSISKKNVAENIQWKSLTRTLSEILAPTYAMFASKIQQPTPAALLPDKKDEENGNPILKRSLTVKEYILQKLEPGDDERALLQAITETISPRKNASVLGLQESKESNTPPLPVSTMPHIQTAISVPADHYPLISSKSFLDESAGSSFPDESAGSRELEQQPEPVWSCPRCKSIIMTPASSSLTFIKRSVTVNPDIFRRDSSRKYEIEKTRSEKRRKKLREFLNPETM